MIFGKKQREIERLENLVRHQTQMFNQLAAGERNKRIKMQAQIDELEAIKQTATLADLTTLMASIQDYRNVLNRLCAPDPVCVARGLPELFEKYSINWTVK